MRGSRVFSASLIMMVFPRVVEEEGAGPEDNMAISRSQARKSWLG